MHVPIAVEPGTATMAYGVVVPDFPGCFSAGDTLDDALSNAKQAVTAWIEATLGAGGTVPPLSSLERLARDPACKGWILAVVSTDPATPDDTPWHPDAMLSGVQR